MSNPLLSVIVPVYNAEKYIKRCIESILNQTLTDLELILVDDGSTDNSGIICDEYTKFDNRVKVIHKVNGGAASARNVGISIANGDYIGFCDSDDFLNHSMYKDLIDIMLINNLETISCTSNTYDESGNLLETGQSNKEISILNHIEYIKKIYLWEADVSLCTRITKAKIIKQIKIPEKRRVEDFYFTILLLTKTKKTAIYNYPYYEYTINPKSVTHLADSTIYFDALFFFEKTKSFLNDNTFFESQMYYKFKALYLLFISISKTDTQKYKLNLLCHKAFIKCNFFLMLKNQHLRAKEKAVLALITISIKLPRIMYAMKKSGD